MIKEMKNMLQMQIKYKAQASPFEIVWLLRVKKKGKKDVSIWFVPIQLLDRTVLLSHLKKMWSIDHQVHENAGGKSFNVVYVLNCEKGEEQVNFCIHTMLGGKWGISSATK